MVKDEKVECRKNEKQTGCKPFRVDASELKASEGSYVAKDQSEDKDGDITTLTLTISRVDGSFSEET